MSQIFKSGPRKSGVWFKTSFKNIDLGLLLLILIFMTIGLGTLYSASVVFPARFDAQLKNWIFALLLIVGIAQIKSDYLRMLAIPIYLVGVSLLLGVELFGETRKGATRWLNLGLISIQPSELMKITTPMALAWWFYQREQIASVSNYIIAGVILVVPSFLILHQPDLGTALLVLFAGLGVIFFAGLSWKLIIPPTVLLVAGLSFLVVNQTELCRPGVDWYVLKEFQVKRVCTLLNPEFDPGGSGYHILQSTIAIGSGGLTGKGFLEGKQAHLEFIPESTTDFIFAVYAEEFGLLGNGILLFLYLLLIWRGLKIAGAATNEFSRLLACGITLIFFVCVFVNLGMVSGILPVVGVPLPFMSYGGTALISFAIGAGILMAIAGETRREQKDQRKIFH